MSLKNDYSKIILCVVCFFCLSSVSFSKEIIKNKDLKQINDATGLPTDFKIQGIGDVHVQWNNAVNCLKFDLKDGEHQVVTQSGLLLKTGKRYRLSWWAMGDSTLKYMIYVEGVYQINGEKKWDCFNNIWRNPGSKWKQYKFEFTYNSNNPKLPYLAIQAQGSGVLLLKNFDMTELQETTVSEINLGKIATRSNGKNKVLVGPGNVIQIKGQPFFPVFLWGTPALPPTTDLLQQMRSNGLNCYCTALTADLPQVLNIAHENEMMVIVQLPSLFWMKGNPISQYHNLYEMLTPEIVNHPALFGYILGDELLWTNKELKPILQAYSFMKKVDPYHPVLLNEAPRNTIAALAEYGRACDIYGVDIYPVGSSTHSDLEEKGLPSVGQYALRMRKAVKEKKPIWMVLQGFSWSVLTKGDKESKYPDYNQTRFMAYDSIINGSTMICWWGLLSVDKPSFYDTLFSVTRELYQIKEVLVAPSLREEIVCSNKSIEFIAKKISSGIVILAANTSDSIMTADFNAKLTRKEIEVLFENRNIKVNASGFSDSFKPYEVHVYSLSPLVMTKLPSDKSNKDCFLRQSAIVATTPYSGKANWIWFPGKSDQQNSKCEFKRIFTLKEDVSDATLIATADDYCKISINGNVVLENGNWEQAGRISVAKFLKKGTNVILISANDLLEAPCGLLFDLQIEKQDGTKDVILSDTNWMSKDIETGEVRAAEIIAPYGDKPWKAKLRIYDIKN